MIVIKRIIINETLYIEGIINNRKVSVNAKDIPYILGIAGKYFHQKQDYKPKQIRDRLSGLASTLINDGAYKYKELIDKIASGDNKKVPLIELCYVPITEAEIECIEDNISSVSERRLAFTLLCLAKFRNCYIENNSGWETYEFADIFRLANINYGDNASKAKMMNNLIAKGLINPSKKITNTNYQVLFIEDDSPLAMKITDFRDIGNQLMQYLGGDYLKCSICGSLVKKTPEMKNRKYCNSCRKKYGYENTNSKNMYIPLNQRSIVSRCANCGKEILINPSLMWLDCLCDDCKKV